MMWWMIIIAIICYIWIKIKEAAFPERDNGVSIKLSDTLGK